MTGPLPTPALTQWRAELQAGTRTRTTFDPLWRAACEEMNALEHAPYPGLAEKARQRVRDILTAAARP